MKLDQVAVQFYTLRDFCKTAPAFAKSCRKVRSIGFEAIQVSAIGPIPEEEIVGICAGEGLTICATHESGERILSSPHEIVERLRKLNCKYTAYPFPRNVDLADLDAVRKLARQLDASGAVLRQAGQVLTYHNHALEFLKLDDKTVLDIIYDESNEQNLQAEIDTYWVQLGGGDPAAWCRKLRGRLPLLHLKDCVGTVDNTSQLCEIGSGNLNFKEIVAAAANAGCEWYIVEQDTCKGDPFDSLKISFQYIKANLIS
jgi:sugar phosphate isomerase/epimerase